MVVRLESHLNSKLTTLMAQRNHLSQETDLLDSLLQEVQAQINSATAANLIFRSPALSAMFAEVHKTPMASFVSAPVPAEFQRFVELFCEHFLLTLLSSQFALFLVSSCYTLSHSVRLFYGGGMWELNILDMFCRILAKSCLPTIRVHL